MKIFVGADHRGFKLKVAVIELVTRLGHEAVDLGSFQEEAPCDYPEIAYAVASSVAANPGSRGILACMSGIGHAVAANKVKGAYAALCYNRESAVLSREHNNANILVVGSQFVPAQAVEGIVTAWLTTEFTGGRHLRRFQQIQDIEERTFR